MDAFNKAPGKKMKKTNISSLIRLAFFVNTTGSQYFFGGKVAKIKKTNKKKHVIILSVGVILLLYSFFVNTAGSQEIFFPRKYSPSKKKLAGTFTRRLLEKKQGEQN